MVNYFVIMSSAAQRLHRGLRAGLVLAALAPGFCCGLGSRLEAAGAAPAVPDYQHAVESFNREEYDAAAAMLDKIPANGNPKDRADILNLRGAIYLHQKHFESARALFARARSLDPGLWAATFNEAEADFEAKSYGDSRREFTDLLAQTSAGGHPREYALVQYKALLAGLLGGNPKPARAFLAEHAKDTPPPAAYFFLNAAAEYQQSHQHEAAQWLARAGSSYSSASEQVYAQAFTELGWPVPHNDRAGALAEAGGAADPQTGAAPKQLPPATLAVVQLIPGHGSAANVPIKPPEPDAVEKPAFRFNGPMAIPLPAEQPPAVQDAPPGPDDDLKSPAGAEGGMMLNAQPLATILKRHRASATPTPTAAPSSSPDATAADSSAPADSASPAGGDAGTASPAASATASPDASATPGSSAAPAQPGFVQKYEAAYVKFIQKDYPAATALLDEADAIQPNQPSSISLRGQIFKHYYEAAYVDYLKSDYTGAIAQLDLADGEQRNQPDAANLRGLVFSRQHNYEQAESMFKKAIQTDPTFWAAKFNLAELPFNYRNYTAARARFEDLFAQTDPVKQPREAELTQFKVFLTLLLEGKEPAARSFMEHFTFSGTTPARYFCQSALDFYHGDVDKAMGWLDSAKKEYPAQLVSIFIESFYRVGWMTDPTAHPELAGGPGAGGVTLPGATPVVAAATPAATAPSAGAKPTPAVAAVPITSAKPTPAVAAATPAATAPAIAAKPTPAAVVSSGTAVAPGVPAVATSPTPAKAPAVAVAPAPAASLAPGIAKAPPTVAAVATASPVLVRPTPAAPVIASKPAATAPPVFVRPTPAVPVVALKPAATPAAKPAAAVTASQAPAVAAMSSPGPILPAEAAESSATPATGEETAAAGGSAASELVRYLFLIIVIVQTAFVWAKVGMAFKRRNIRLARARSGRARSKAVEPDKVEAP
jgi:tetratricopeptide (TPR) repeat protein